MNVLVDTSVWIDYFKKSENIDSGYINELIDNNQICINDLILSEIVPFLKIKKQNELIDILKSVRKMPLVIDWNEITEFQIVSLKNGLNKIGIPDLIIMQNVIKNELTLYSLDKHFKLLSKIFKFRLI